MSSENHSSITHIILKALRFATKFVHRDFAEIDLLQSSRSGTLKFASNTYAKIQRNLVTDLSEARPDAYIYNENGEVLFGSPSSEHHFLVVAMDSFSNFMHAVPLFATGVAYSKKNYKGDYETLSIVIDVPAQREFYYCEKGAAAWREVYTEGNTRPNRLRVSERKLPDELLVNCSHLKLPGFDLKKLSIDAPLIDILYTALGKFDAMRLKNPNLLPFLSIVTESGGVIDNTENGIIARNFVLDNIKIVK